jgi:catechol 2,3-dioxygenase-like lactoylglutathione lyase family enzyme
MQRKFPGDRSSLPLGFDHVAFTVDSREELFALKDRLEAAGIEVEGAVDHGLFWSIYFFDPHNNVPLEATWQFMELEQIPAISEDDPLTIAAEGADMQAGHWPEVSSPTPESEMRASGGNGQPMREDCRRRLKPAASALRARHYKYIIDRRVLLVSQPRQWFNPVDVNQTVDEHFVPDMSAENLADNGRIDAVRERTGQVNFLVKLAFQVDRRLTHPRRPDQRRILGMQACQLHFIDLVPDRRGAGIHRILQRQWHHVDDELPAGFYIVQGILFTTVLVIPGKRNHYHRRIACQTVKKAEWRQVDCTVGMNRTHPGNRPGDDATLERVVRESMMFAGFIKHVAYAPAKMAKLTPMPPSRKPVSNHRQQPVLKLRSYSGRGRVNNMLQPWPKPPDSIQISPPCTSTIRFTRVRPTPVPSTSWPSRSNSSNTRS